jgi:hypothetical protein
MLDSSFKLMGHADHGYRLLMAVIFLLALSEVAVVDHSMNFQTTVVQ